MKNKTNQLGFTVIELMIATLVFSIFLLILSIMTIRIGRLFQKGILAAQTQDAARSISTEIARAIQFSGGDINSDTAAGYICAGAQRYSFVLGKQLTDGSPGGDKVSHVLVTDNSTVCLPKANLAAFTPATQREMMPNNMRLANLVLLPASGSTGLFTLTVRVVYGDFELLDNPNTPAANCKPGSAQTQFCAVSELTTTIQKRL